MTHHTTAPRELLTATSIAALPAQTKIHDLNPNAVRISQSLGDAVGLQHLGLHRVTVQPGRDTTEYHRHWYEEEFVYVLSGQGTADIGGQLHPVGPGDFMGFGRDAPSHSLTNTGTVPLVCLVGGQRLAQDVCDYPRQNKRLYINGEREDLVDLQHIQP